MDPFVLKPAFKDSIIGIFIFMRHMHLFPETLISVMSDCCLLMSLMHILHVLLRMLFLALHFSSVKWFCCCITKCLLAKIPDICVSFICCYILCSLLVKGHKWKFKTKQQKGTKCWSGWSLSGQLISYNDPT